MTANIKPASPDAFVRFIAHSENANRLFEWIDGGWLRSRWQGGCVFQAMLIFCQ